MGNAKTIDFLKKIYGTNCSNGDYIVLAVKRGKVWKDIPIQYEKKNFGRKLKGFFEKYPDTKYDLYWSPQPYSRPNRKKQFSKDTKYMVQDIDEYGDPSSIEPKPTYIWESSPNKYQGIWELDRYIPESQYTPLNKSLAKYIGCDDCFDFVHVYRIPGTKNHKYKNTPKVGLPKSTTAMYKPKTLRNLVDVGEKEQRTRETLSLNNITNIEERKIYAKYNIPVKVRELLALDSTEGIDRSDTIWYIENKLSELGMEPNEIIYLVKNSVFNKYRDRGDEDERLRSELDKILSNKLDGALKNKRDKEKPLNHMVLESFDDLMIKSHGGSGWLVKGFWPKGSQGIVSGMPKTFKSTLVHDFAISVATGKPFLGRFPVVSSGPVVIVQNENSSALMEDRTRKMVNHKGYVGTIDIKRNSFSMKLPENPPLYFVNQAGFTFNSDENKRQLEEILEDKKPVLLILDPLYTMFEGDLNSSQELNPILNWLIEIKTKYNLSIILVHHYNKGGSNAPQSGGSRVLGSVTLYGWLESAWYLTKEKNDDDLVYDGLDEASNKPTTITMDREFRTAGNHPTLDINLTMGPFQDAEAKYSVDVGISQGSNSFVKKQPISIRESVIESLKKYPNGAPKEKILSGAGGNKEEKNIVFDELIKAGKVKKVGDGLFKLKGD